MWASGCILDQINHIQTRNLHQKQTKSVFSPSIPHKFAPVHANPSPGKLTDLRVGGNPTICMHVSIYLYIYIYTHINCNYIYIGGDLGGALGEERDEGVHLPAGRLAYIADVNRCVFGRKTHRIEHKYRIDGRCFRM